MPYTLKNLITTEGSSASYEKRLSICLEADGFSFTETTADGTLLTFGEAIGTHAASITDATGAIKSLFAEASIRPMGNKHLELTVVSDESVWVPDELYTPASNRQYLKLAGASAITALTCRCAQIQSTAVFSANEQLVMAFKVALPGVAVMNQHARVVSLAPLSASHPVLFSYWRKGRVDVAAFVDGRYIFGNTLAVENPDEAPYRVVEVMKAYDMEKPDVELLVSGDVDRDRYAQLRPFFPKVTLYNGNFGKYSNPRFRTLHTYRYALALI